MSYAALAEIAYQALQQQLELSLEGFQYKNSLIIEQANKKLEVENMYYNRYQDVLQQINTENALAEEIRQYNESLALEREKLAEDQRQFNAQLAEEQRQFNAVQASKSSGGSSGGGDSSGGSSGSGKKKISGSSGKSIGGSGSSPTVDMQSVLDLGYGPISAETLAKKVATGEIIQYTEGGKIKYKKPNASQFVAATIKKPWE